MILLPNFITIIARIKDDALIEIAGNERYIEELRVELPGEQEQPEDIRLREADDRGEEEYERRTVGVGAEQASAIAVEISRDRREEEGRPPEAIETINESENTKEKERSKTPSDKGEGKQ